jgi:hypothetical protein
MFSKRFSYAARTKASTGCQNLLGPGLKHQQVFSFFGYSRRLVIFFLFLVWVLFKKGTTAENETSYIILKFPIIYEILFGVK